METLNGGNSIRAREAANQQKPKEQIQPVVSSTTVKKKNGVEKFGTTVKKKNGVEKFVKSLLAENIGNIGSYLIFDVVAPAVKNALYDMSINTIGAIFGKAPSSKSSSSTTYHRAYSSARNNETKSFPSVSTNVYDVNEVIFATRNDAKLVLTTLCDYLDQYPTVSVADFYDAARQVPSPVDNKWGWSSLVDAKVVALAGGGYTIRFPRVKPLD